MLLFWDSFFAVWTNKNVPTNPKSNLNGGGKFRLCGTLPRKNYLDSNSHYTTLLGDNKIKTSSKYGYRIHSIYHTLKFHAGIDMTATTTDTIVVSADGIVE